MRRGVEEEELELTFEEDLVLDFDFLEGNLGIIISLKYCPATPLYSSILILIESSLFGELIGEIDEPLKGLKYSLCSLFF